MCSQLEVTSGWAGYPSSGGAGETGLSRRIVRSSAANCITELTASTIGTLAEAGEPTRTRHAPSVDAVTASADLSACGCPHGFSIVGMRGVVQCALGEVDARQCKQYRLTIGRGDSEVTTIIRRRWPVGLAATLALSIGGLVVDGTGRCEGSDEIRTVVRYQQAYFERLSSLSFQSTSELEMSEWGQERYTLNTGKSPAAAADDLSHSLRFAWEDGKILYELRRRTYSDGAPPDPVLAEAFDGSTLYERSADVFATSPGAYAGNRTSGENPLAVLFQFAATSPASLTIPDLFRTETWDIATARATRIREMSLDGMPGVQVDFVNAGGNGVTWRVFFAAAADYLPMRVESLFANGGRRNRCVVGEFQTYETALGPVAFPLRIECENWVTSGHLASTERFVIDRESVVINQDIPDDVFVLPLPDFYGSPDPFTGGVIAVDARLAKDKPFARALLQYMATHEGELSEEARAHIAPDMYARLDAPLAEAVARTIGELVDIEQYAYAAPVGGVVQVTWSMHGNARDIRARLGHDRTGLVTSIELEVDSEWVGLAEFVAQDATID